ncbi:hypothetical protein NC99_08010 [Sunxiuqinia dokdonensis]|uniref:Uncharacterized protein n=1 Tax=Sunxiuqinia dokdonensis TaxID=1409788 RepID=A0A0L8VD18_9BACT|nr:hypothetical protein NC99_08010 [Sunxiuqinia dokdonensis]
MKKALGVSLPQNNKSRLGRISRAAFYFFSSRYGYFANNNSRYLGNGQSSLSTVSSSLSIWCRMS